MGRRLELPWCSPRINTKAHPTFVSPRWTGAPPFVVIRAWNLPSVIAISPLLSTGGHNTHHTTPHKSPFLFDEEKPALKESRRSDGQPITSAKRAGTVGIEPTYFMSTDEIIELPLF